MHYRVILLVCFFFILCSLIDTGALDGKGKKKKVSAIKIDLKFCSELNLLAH